VAPAIAPRRFTMNTHTLCWKHWQVRPRRGEQNPAQCDTRYCHYDDLHADYIYTPEWAELLINELQNQDTYAAVLASARGGGQSIETAA